MADSNSHDPGALSLLDTHPDESAKVHRLNTSQSQAASAEATCVPDDQQQQQISQSPGADERPISPVESQYAPGSPAWPPTQAMPADGATTAEGQALNDSAASLLAPATQSATQAPQSQPVAGNQSGGYFTSTQSKARRSYWSIASVWLPEIAAATVAVGIFVCEIVVLAHYDKKLVELHWSHSWKINAVFAFLTTFLEAAIMFYVGACIGQLRWHWYMKKQHRLDWLDIMTNARQPSGALRLLLRRGMQRQFAAFGCIIVLLLLGVSTFTQNVITQILGSYSLGPNTGSVPVQTSYFWADDGTSGRVLGDQQPVPDMMAAIQGGFYSFSSLQVPASVSDFSYCEGDTCDFGKYQSLAVCGQCANMSSAVVNPCPGGRCTSSDYYTLQNGIDLSLQTTNGVLNLTSDTQFPVTETLSSIVGPLIVRFHAMVANQANIAENTNRTGTGASAVECAAWWCVKTHSGKMINGTLQEDQVDEWTDTSVDARTSYLQAHDIDLRPPQCVFYNKASTDQSYCTFQAGAWSQAAIQNFLTGGRYKTFGPFLTGSTEFYGSGESRYWKYTSQLAGALTSNSTAKIDMERWIKQGFETMTHYMSINIREGSRLHNTDLYTHGNATYQAQEFEVRWGWLAYPTCLVVLSLIFFVGTIILTRNEEIWKSSILATMFHGFNDADRRRLGSLNTAEEMDEIIRNQKVMFKDDGTGNMLFEAGPSVPPRHGSGYNLGEKASRVGVHTTEAGFSFLDAGNINLP